MAKQEMLLDTATIKAAVAGEKWATNLIAGRTPKVTIVVLPYGFVLATQIKDRL